VMRLPRLDQDILSGVPMSLKRLPEGKSPSRMSSPFCKNIFVFLCRKSLHRRSHPASTRATVLRVRPAISRPQGWRWRAPTFGG